VNSVRKLRNFFVRRTRRISVLSIFTGTTLLLIGFIASAFREVVLWSQGASLLKRPQGLGVGRRTPWGRRCRIPPA
jgi:hypothetical protein